MSSESAPRTLFLYGKPGCCLCDQLESQVTQILTHLGMDQHIQVQKRNVLDQRDWHQLYSLRIPVLTAGADVLVEGCPDQQELHTALRCWITGEALRSQL